MFSTVTVKYDSYDIMGRKYEHIDSKYKGLKESKMHINLDELHTLQIINYNSNMINERAIKLII